MFDGTIAGFIGLIASIMGIVSIIYGIYRWLQKRKEIELEKERNMFVLKNLYSSNNNDFLSRRYYQKLVKHLSEKEIETLSYLYYRDSFVSNDELKKLLLTSKIRNSVVHNKNTSDTLIDSIIKAALKEAREKYEEPPQLLSHFLNFLPKEFRDKHQQEIINCIKDGIHDRKKKIQKKIFVITEIWNLIVLVGKYKLFGFVFKRRKTIQTPS